MATGPRFSLLGVPVRIDPSFFIMAVFLGWGVGREPLSLLLWVVVVLVSVLWHEMGHAIAFRSFGYQSNIELYAMGGLTYPHTDAPLPPARDLAVSLAGPLSGIALGVTVLALARSNGPATATTASQVARDLVFANLGWGILNLVPILPLDGGRVMKAVLDLATRGRGERPALMVSVVAAAAGILAALRFGQPFMALIVGYLGYTSFNSLQRQAPAPKQEHYAGWLAEGWAALEQGALLAASNRAREVLNGATAPDVRAGAVQLLLWATLLDGKTADAAVIMRELPQVDPVLPAGAVAAAGGEEAAIALLQGAFDARPDDATGAHLSRALISAGRLDDALALVSGASADRVAGDTNAFVGAALYQAARFEDAARIGERIFHRQPHPTLAYNLACTWARQGRQSEAVDWLDRAADLGFADVALLDSDADLAPLRPRADFQALRQRLASSSAGSGHGSVDSSGGGSGYGSGYGSGEGSVDGSAGRHEPLPAPPPVAATPPPPLAAASADAGPSAPAAPSRTSRSRGTPGVIAILVLLAAVFVLQQFLAQPLERFSDYPALIAVGGQWYRLVTAAFLHVDLVHIGLNSYALWALGPSVEMRLGTPRFLAVYAVTGFIGNAISYAFANCAAGGVGASGAVFGVLGALVVLTYVSRKADPGALQRIVVAAAVMLLIGYALPGGRIGNTAHLGGLIGGLVVTAGIQLAVRFGGHDAAGRRTPLNAVLQALVVVAVVLAGVGLVAWRTQSFTCGPLGL